MTIYSWDIRRSSTKCDMCGTTEQHLSKNARVGCAKCYSVFNYLLASYIKQIHGQTEYVGETPSGYEIPRQELIQQLKTKMQKAIIEQNFEQAAELRDAIKEIEAKEDKS